MTVAIDESSAFEGSGDCGWLTTFNVEGDVDEDGTAAGTCTFDLGWSETTIDADGAISDDGFYLEWEYSVGGGDSWATGKFYAE